VLFVTHRSKKRSLRDRVWLMSPGPGRIDSQMLITLPRPRDVVASDFNDIRRELSLRLHSHQCPQGGRDMRLRRFRLNVMKPTHPPSLAAA